MSSIVLRPSRPASLATAGAAAGAAASAAGAAGARSLLCSLFKDVTPSSALALPEAPVFTPSPAATCSRRLLRHFQLLVLAQGIRPNGLRHHFLVLTQRAWSDRLKLR